MEAMIILLIILVNMLFYARTLTYHGICDDIPVYNQNVTIPKGKWMYFWYHLHGRKYAEWRLPHIQTLIIHTLNCVLIYLAFGMNQVSAAAALLFSVNPTNNQCSMWMSGKGYAQNLTCALLMWMFPFFSIIPYLYGTYFHGASLLLFPLVFLFTKHWWLAGLAILGLWREYSRVFNKADPNSKFNTESNDELKAIAPRKLIMLFKTLGYYISNTASARILGFYHKYLFLHGVSPEDNKKSYKIDMYFFLGILLALTTLLTQNIGLVWFCVSVLMWCNFISFNQTITNRYIYMPNAGLMLVIASVLIKWPLALVALFTYYATRLAYFQVFYKNEYWSIEHSCFEQPDFFYPWQNRAVHCFQNNNYQGALGNLIKCNELRPNDWKVTYNLAQVYMILGNMKAAREWFGKASQCKIDGREEVIGSLMARLKKWMDEVDAQAKANNNQVNIDIKKFDMQR